MLLLSLLIAICPVIIALLILHFSVESLGLALLLVFLLYAVLKPKIFFIFFILTRPVMDLVAGHKLMGLNLASGLTLFFILICGAAILNKNNLSRLAGNTFLNRFNKLFLTFTVFSLASLINTTSGLLTVTDLLRFISIMVAVNFGFLYFSDSKKPLKLVWLISASAIVPLLFGLYQVISKTGSMELGFNRIQGTLVHPNVFAQYLLIIFYVLLYIITAYRPKHSGKKILVYAFLFLTIVELFLTYMRGAWIALAASFSLFIFLRTRGSTKIKYIVFGLLIFVVCFPQVKKRFSDVNETKYYQLSSWQWRLQSWVNAGKSLGRHPVIGNGMGMYEHDFEIGAHNDYLRIAYETGFLGLIFYLSVLLYIVAYAFKKVLKAVRSRELNRYKTAFCLVCCLMITSAADNLARSTVIFVYFFLALAYFLGIESV